MYPYLWEELKEFGYQLLKDSTDTKRSQELLDKIKGLDSIISQLKSEWGLTKEEIEKLRRIVPKKFEKAVLRKVMTKQRYLHTTEWNTQADIDCELLKDRISYCTAVWDEVHDLLHSSIVKSNLVKGGDFMFAGVKA